MRNSKIFLFVLILTLLLVFTAQAEIRTITKEFKESVGLLNGSKDFNHTVHMPGDMAAHGWNFISKTVETRGDARVHNESLTNNRYNFTLRLSSSFLSSASGRVIVTLQAERGGSTPYVPPTTSPGQPPDSGGSYPGGSTKVDPNKAPSPSYPRAGTRVRVNSSDRVEFRWDDSLDGKRFRVRVYTENGSRIVNKTVSSNKLRVRGREFKNGMYKWQVARDNRAGFLTNLPLIGSAFSDWSNYSTPIHFRVQRLDDDSTDPSYPWQQPTQPSPPGDNGQVTSVNP
ncbi:MAG: hypothetical protein ACQESP_07855, partial [Candidatus Muiribacteriota bacterium]